MLAKEGQAVSFSSEEGGGMGFPAEELVWCEQGTLQV